MILSLCNEVGFDTTAKVNFSLTSERARILFTPSISLLFDDERRANISASGLSSFSAAICFLAIDPNPMNSTRIKIEKDYFEEQPP